MKNLLRKYIRKQINEMFVSEAGENTSSIGTLSGLDALKPQADDQVQNIEDIQNMTQQTIDSNIEAVKQIELQKKNLELNKKRAGQELKSSVPADPLTPPSAVNTLKSVNNAKVKNIDKMQKDNLSKSKELTQQNKDLEKKLSDMENLQKTFAATTTKMNSTSSSTPSAPVRE